MRRRGSQPAPRIHERPKSLMLVARLLAVFAAAAALRAAPRTAKHRTAQTSAVRGGEQARASSVAHKKAVADAVSAGAGVMIGFSALAILSSRALPHLPGAVTVLCPPLGALAVILFCTPEAPAARPRALVLGHLVGSAAALCFARVRGPDGFGPGAAVALTVIGQKLLDCVHPPAAAYAFLVAAQRDTEPMRLLSPGLLGALCLLATQHAYLRVLGVVGLWSRSA